MPDRGATMSTIKDVWVYACEIGAEVDVTKVRGRWDVNVFPPEGKQWKEGGGLPILVAHQLGDDASAMFDDLLFRMREGLEDAQ